MVQVGLSEASVNLGDKIGVVIHPKKLNSLGRARVCKNEWVAEELTITDLTLEADGNSYPSKGEALRNLTD